VRFSEIEMILASVIFGQSYRNNDCSPVQWVDIDMILASVILRQHLRFNVLSPVQ